MMGSDKTEIGSIDSSSAANENPLLVELRRQKKILKNELKQYDTDFSLVNHRMPTKREKEPIRYKYERYIALKTSISSLEEPKKKREELTRRLATFNSHAREEKSDLYLTLRDYETSFFWKNKRQVACLEDIKPRIIQYRRYKEMK